MVMLQEATIMCLPQCEAIFVIDYCTASGGMFLRTLNHLQRVTKDAEIHGVLWDDWSENAYSERKSWILVSKWSAGKKLPELVGVVRSKTDRVQEAGI